MRLDYNRTLGQGSEDSIVAVQIQMKVGILGPASWVHLPDNSRHRYKTIQGIFSAHRYDP